MKEVIGKAWKTQPLLSCKIIVNNIKINEEKRIANKLNNFLIDNDPELAKEIPRSAKPFESHVPNFNTTIPNGPVCFNELKNAFFQ